MAALPARQRPGRPRRVGRSSALRPSLEPARQRRTVQNVVVIRWLAIVWAVVQVTTYYLPYPPGALTWAVVAIGILLAGNVGIWVALPRVHTPAAIRRLALASVLVDGIAIMALVYAYTFDPDTAIWAVLYIVPLGAAALFQLRGALWAMAAVTVAYTVRELYGHAVFGNELLVVSITFRMGVGFIIAAFAGAMASGLVSRLGELRVLNRITRTVADERDLRRALDAVAADMLSIFAVRGAAIVLLDATGQGAVVMADRAVEGADLEPLAGRRFDLDGSPVLKELVTNPAPVVVTDAEAARTGDDVGAVMRQRDTRSLLLVPLLVRATTIGAVALETEVPGRAFSPAEVALAETIAGQIAGAIDNTRLFDEMVEYIQQVRQVTDAAGAVEQGGFRVESLDEVGRRPDELGQLARVFQRMARQVEAREQRLRQEVRQLRIEIDEVRAARRVAEITESDYFQELQRKADKLRLDSRP